MGDVRVDGHPGALLEDRLGDRARRAVPRRAQRASSSASCSATRERGTRPVSKGRGACEPPISGDRPGALDGVRVVELASEHGAFAGKILADLGAEVIVVEPPGGHAVPWLRALPRRRARTRSAACGGGTTTPASSVSCSTSTMSADRRRFGDLVAGERHRPRVRAARTAGRAGSRLRADRRGAMPGAGLGVGHAVRPDQPRAHEPATDLTILAGAGRRGAAATTTIAAAGAPRRQPGLSPGMPVGGRGRMTALYAPPDARRSASTST